MSEGVKADSFTKGQKFYMDEQDLMFMDRFLKPRGGAPSRGRGGRL